MITIGIDNGVSGSIGILSTEDTPRFCKTPTMKTLGYTKNGGMITRIDHNQLTAMFRDSDPLKATAYVERPVTMKNIKTVMSGSRSYEATLVVLEKLGIGYETIDSRHWQKSLLGGVKGSAALKRASMSKGIQLYPQFRKAIEKQGDADGLLIAHYYRNK